MKYLLILLTVFALVLPLNAVQAHQGETIVALMFVDDNGDGVRQPASEQGEALPYYVVWTDGTLAVGQEGFSDENGIANIYLAVGHTKVTVGANFYEFDLEEGQVIGQPVFEMAWSELIVQEFLPVVQR